MIKFEKIEGIADVSRQITSLVDDKMKRSEILKILRRQVKPLLREVKNQTPVAQKILQVRDRKYSIGNLRDSMKIKTSKMKHYPNVLVGPKMGGKKNKETGRADGDGFYAFFIQYGYAGTRHSGANKIPARDFIYDAFKKVGASVERNTSKDLERYINRKIKKLNL